MRKILFAVLILSVNIVFSQKKIKTYIGRKEWCMYGNDSECINYTKENPNEKWFFEYTLKIIDDRLVYIDRCAIIKKGKSILHSASDGGFYFYKGTKDKSKIITTLIDCDYCRKEVSTGKPMKEILQGTITKDKIELNGIQFHLVKNKKEKLFSEKY